MLYLGPPCGPNRTRSQSVVEVVGPPPAGGATHYAECKVLATNVTSLKVLMTQGAHIRLYEGDLHALTGEQATVLLLKLSMG